MWRLGLEILVFGGVCLLFAGSVSAPEIVIALLAGCFAVLWHARLIRHSAFRFAGRPDGARVLGLAVKGALGDVPEGGWHVTAALWRRRFGRLRMEPAPVLVRDRDVHVIPKRRALAILTTSFGPLAYVTEAHHEALRVHRVNRTIRPE